MTHTDTFRSEVKRAARHIERYLGEHAERVARVAARETGSPVSYQYHDIKGARSFLRRIGALEKLLPATYRFEPKGNVLLVLSANEPIITASILVFSGLFMGNTICVRPSSKSPSYARMITRELSRVPTMRGRVNCLSAGPEEIERLIRARTFDLVLAFGSRGTNKKLGIICAESEVEFLPESEGNDWAYIDKSCQPLKTLSATLIDSFTRHNGQMCNALRGVMVHAAIYTKLLEQLKKDFDTLAVGSPMRIETRIGTLIAGTEARAQEIAREAANAARDVWTLPAPGCTTPMIIVEPNDTSSILSESIFAPVLWLKSVKDHTEAVRLFEERNRHGLGFSVFSSDKKVVEECVRRIRVGRVNVNKPPLDIGLFDPLGGIRLSGHGGPRSWVEKMSNRKFVNA